MFNYFIDLKNNIDFALRNNTHLSRKNYSEASESKESYLSTLTDPLKIRELYLTEKYNLHEFKFNSSVSMYSQNLYLLNLLDKYFELEGRDKLSCLDIGCKNWIYATAEYHFLKSNAPRVTLSGIEIDYGRLYTNLYSRFEVAKFYTKNLRDCNYIKGDFLLHDEKYDCIIWLLPFLFDSTHLDWGLPKKAFKPEEMLLHAVKSLNEEGKMFIINQGRTEFEHQKCLCEKFSINYKPIGKVESGFFEHKNERFALIVKN